MSVRHAALSLLLLPAVAHGQTEEVQRDVDRRLWLLWAWEGPGLATGLPAGAARLMILGVGVALAAAAWLYRSWRVSGNPRKGA